MKTKKITIEVNNTPIEERGILDYHYWLTKWTSAEQRDKWNTWDIWINWAVCLKCKDFIRSRNQHDFRWCFCKSIAVDGWSWYERRIGNPEDYINVVEYFDNPNLVGLDKVEDIFLKDKT